MPSTDIDGTPILILRHKEVITLSGMFRWIPGEWPEDVSALLKKIDRFLVETGDEPIRGHDEGAGREGSGEQSQIGGTAST